MKKKILMFMSIVSMLSFSSSNIEFLKEFYKNKIMLESQTIKETDLAKLHNFGVRMEADAILELADEGFDMYETFRSYKREELKPSGEVVLAMPRIDKLEEHINAVTKKSLGDVFVFIMEGDKLEGNEIYGDRSWETYEKSGLANRLPSKVKVFKLLNESVTSKQGLNNYEIEQESFYESAVYKNQIVPILLVESKLLESKRQK